MSDLNKFTNLKKIKTELDVLLNTLKLKLTKLKDTYVDFVQNNKSNVFIFGLDSFYFQSKLLDDEYENLIASYKMILNRMYCEYYKLYKLIVNYIKDNVSDTKINDIVNQNVNTIVIYKDLEPKKEYDFKQFELINKELLSIIGLLHSKLNEKEKTLEEHEEKQKIGLNINNFVSSYSYEVAMFKNQIMLFENYLSFFYKLHFKYLQRFITKVQVFYTQINHDIIFDTGIGENKEPSFNSDENTFEFEDDSDIDGELTDEIINTLQRSISKCNINSRKKIMYEDSNESVKTKKKNRRKTMDKSIKLEISEILEQDNEIDDYIEDINDNSNVDSNKRVSINEDDEIILVEETNNEETVVTEKTNKEETVVAEEDNKEETVVTEETNKEETVVAEETNKEETNKEETNKEETNKEETVVEAAQETNKEETLVEAAQETNNEETVVETSQETNKEEVITEDNEDDNESIYSMITAETDMTSETSNSNTESLKHTLSKSQKKRLRKKLKENNNVLA